MAVKTTPTAVPVAAESGRWYRRTSVYIAEYIIMLILVGGLSAAIISLWYSFFGLIANDSFTARAAAQVTAVALGSILVVAPAAWWLYSRVAGEEAANPEVRSHKARTVFLVMWLIVAATSLVAIVAGMVGSLSQAVFGFADDAGNLLLTSTLPALFSAVTLAVTIYTVAKGGLRGAGKLGMWVLLGLAAVVFVANLIMVLVRKESGSEPVIERCTYSMYRDDECTYREYRDYYNQQYRQQDDDRDSTTRDSTNYENLFNL